MLSIHKTVLPNSELTQTSRTGCANALWFSPVRSWLSSQLTAKSTQTCLPFWCSCCRRKCVHRSQPSKLKWSKKMWSKYCSWFTTSIRSSWEMKGFWLELWQKTSTWYIRRIQNCIWSWRQQKPYWRLAHISLKTSYCLFMSRLPHSKMVQNTSETSLMFFVIS